MWMHVTIDKLVDWWNIPNILTLVLLVEKKSIQYTQKIVIPMLVTQSIITILQVLNLPIRLKVEFTDTVDIIIHTLTIFI